MKFVNIGRVGEAPDLSPGQALKAAPTRTIQKSGRTINSRLYRCAPARQHVIPRAAGPVGILFSGTTPYRCASARTYVIARRVAPQESRTSERPHTGAPGLTPAYPQIKLDSPLTIKYSKLT